MSTQAPPPADKAARKSPLAPPDERFWERYSRHHEAPLSGIGSLLLHTVVLGLIVLVTLGILGFRNDRRLAIEPVAIEGNPFGDNRPFGGDGTPRSGGGSEDVGPDSATNPGSAPQVPEETPPRDIDPGEARPTDPKFDTAVRFVPSETAAKTLGALQQRLDQALASGSRQGPGSGAAVKDGGRGPGQGPGGDGTGPQGQPTTRSQQRMLRWVLTIEAADGAEYVKQLRGLGAILAIPKPNTDPPEYHIIRDLGRRPPQLLDEDLTQIKAIYWIDDKPESVRKLATGLGLSMPIDHFVAFLPKQMEERLFQLERSYRGLREEQIHETRFRLKRVGTGYVPEVASQTAKGGR
jgi:hypothetical protein